MGQEAKEQRKEGREGRQLVLQMGTKRDSVGQLQANLICPQSFKDQKA